MKVKMSIDRRSISQANPYAFMIGWMIHFAAEFVEFFDTKK
jgi:hypothetical protein